MSDPADLAYEAYAAELDNGTDLLDPDAYWDVATCPLDGGTGVPLGTLGRLTWHRCRGCGITFSTKED